jgi:release factor glutamine methyltransferase
MTRPVLEIPPQSLGELLREGTAILSRGGIENAAQEAAWLLEAVLTRTRLELHLNDRAAVAPGDRRRVLGLLARRVAREPLQHILGTQEFCGLDFHVGPAVLIPRPETELLVREVVLFAQGASAPVIADVGAGSGCIAVAVARALPGARLFATDVSGAALRVGLRNAERHGVEERVRFLEGDLLEPLARFGLYGQVSVVVSNPPYIPDSQLDDLQPEVRGYEPQVALRGGPDGLVIHRSLLQVAPMFLRPGGLLVLEVGQGQAPAVARWASEYDVYGNIRIIKDDAGIQRVVCATRKSDKSNVKRSNGLYF